MTFGKPDLVNKGPMFSMFSEDFQDCGVSCKVPRMVIFGKGQDLQLQTSRLAHVFAAWIVIVLVISDPEIRHVEEKVWFYGCMR